MRERREVARRADRALPGNARDDAGIDERDERLDHRPAHARVAARERGRLERDDETHDGVVEQRPGAGGMRQHERALQLREPRVVDPRAREEAESGVDAVDGLARRDRRGRRLAPRRRPHGFRGDIDGERHRLRPQAAQIRERRGGRERDRRSASAIRIRSERIVPQPCARAPCAARRAGALIIAAVTASSSAPPPRRPAHTPMMQQYLARQGGASGQAALLPDGRFLRALLRRRAARRAAARHHADRARAVGRRADPDGRRARITRSMAISRS